MRKDKWIDLSIYYWRGDLGVVVSMGWIFWISGGWKYLESGGIESGDLYISAICGMCVCNPWFWGFAIAGGFIGGIVGKIAQYGAKVKNR